MYCTCTSTAIPYGDYRNIMQMYVYTSIGTTPPHCVRTPAAVRWWACCADAGALRRRAVARAVQHAWDWAVCVAVSCVLADVCDVPFLLVGLRARECAGFACNLVGGTL